MSDREDPITTAILSGSAFERLRYEEGLVFTMPATKMLLVQALLLGILALVLPLYVLYPQSVASYMPTMDPFAASPKVLVLGFLCWGIELLSASLLVGLYYHRVRNGPLSAQQARTVINVQEIAASLSIITGGAGIALTVVLFSLGAFGEDALSAYLSVVANGNVFAQSGLGISVAGLAVLSAVTAVAILALRWVLVEVLPDP